MLQSLDAVAAVGSPIRKASCWPIDIRCRDVMNGTDPVVRVKPVRQRTPNQTSTPSAGVAVSEAVSWAILSACDLHVAEPYIVNITAPFAADLSAQGLYDPPIAAGRHWGTRILEGTGLDEDLDWITLDEVGHPEHLFRIFLLDELTGNTDRTTEGNLLLVVDPVLPARLIAIDQSNCFGGPACICDATRLEADRDARHAHHFRAMERLLLERPPEFVDEEFVLIQSHRAEILAAPNLAHDEWYDRACITPEHLANYLKARLDNLATLARRDYWREICVLGQTDVGKLGL